MNHLEPYPAYRDSGVPWLGEVPKHWSVMPNRVTFKEKKERGYPDEQMLSVTITQGVILQSSLLSDTSKKDSSNEDKSKYKLVCQGDIAYNKMRAWQGAVGASGYQGIVSPAYIVVRPRHNQNPRFFHYLFRTPAFAKEAERWSYGISSDQWSLRPEEFKQIYSCVPLLPEQNAIVKYLDYMNRRIRRYINTKKKLIALLNEQKQAIIHQAVTRSLDPNVRLKPSGVEWLGDIPEHWEVRRLKYVCRFEYGDSLPDNMRVRGDIAVYGSNGKIGTHDRGNTSAPCIVIGRKGSFGKVNFSSDSVFAIDTTFFIDERYTSANLRWLYYILTWTKLDSVSKDSAVPGLDRGEAYTQQITYCPRDEQVKIAGWLDQQLASVDRAILKINKEIDLLREYRTRLIADMVTGKLDVREAAASLPDETEGKLSTFEEVESLIDNGAAVDDDEEALTEVTDDD